MEVEESFELEELESKALGDGFWVGRKVGEAGVEEIVNAVRCFVGELGAEEVACDRTGGFEGGEAFFEREHGIEEGAVFEGVDFGLRDAVDPFSFAKGDGERVFFCVCDEEKKACVFCENFEDAPVF